jgi:hypothetical protein
MANGNSTSIDAGKPPRPSTNSAIPAYDPDKDYISTLLLELGQADAIVDLLYMVAAGKAVDSIDALRPDTLTNSLYIALEHLHAVKVAAESILAEGRPVGLKQEVAHARN